MGKSTYQHARSIGRVSRFALVSALLVALGGVIGVTAGPARSQAAPAGYGGSAFVDLVHLDAVEIPGTLKVADLSVAPARAHVASAGLPDPLAPARSASRATNLDLVLLSGAISLNGLLVDAEQVAPPDNAEPTVNELLHLEADPLLDVLLARASAHSRWAGDSACVAPGTPISQAHSEVVDPRVLTGAGGPAGTALVALHNRQGSTVFTRSTVGLVDVEGSANKGVMAEAHTQLTAVTLFDGTPNELTVNVIAPPVVTAVATGQPGGASVTYSEPILQIVQNGTVLGELDAADIDLTVTVPGGVLELKLGTLDATTAPDGTSAEGTANLLSVTVVGPPLPIHVISPLTIAAGTVKAHVPAGGVVCGGPAGGGGGDLDNPLRDVHKDASAGDVRPGSTFTYTVAVPNRGTCTLEQVKVVDTITGPAGTTIESTVPPATSTVGLVTTWDDIGPIAPNETKTLIITVRVPENVGPGEIYRNDVVVSALCDGRAVEQPATISGPETYTPGAGGCQISDSNMAASHEEVFVGESFSYYIHVFNSGDSGCTGVEVTETLIPETDFVSCSDNCTNEERDLTWSIGDLPAGTSRTLIVTVEVGESATPGERLPGAAAIDTAETDVTNVQTPGPIVSTASVLAGPDLPRATGTLAATGPSPVLSLGSLGLVAWFALRRRRAHLAPRAVAAA